MTQPGSATLKKTPLHARHRALGGRMVEFGGWEMPVEYSGIGDEHMAVRTRAGLFDVSHMGEIEVAGDDALAAVQRITSNDASRLAIGQAQYSALTTPEGTFVDDVLTYRLADAHFMLVVNASNIMKDFHWIVEHVKGVGDAVAVNTSSRYALIALQGPIAREVLQQLTGVDLAAMKYYWFATGEVAVREGDDLAHRLYRRRRLRDFCCPGLRRARVGRRAAGRPRRGRGAAGLGARDTLRLEAAMRLYGNDMDETTTVLEADLGWIVGWKKDAFIGADVLRRQKADGVAAKAGRVRDARACHRSSWLRRVSRRRRAGVVTSGTQTPFLKKAIGMAYLPADRTQPGTEFEVDVRGRRAKAAVVPMPFYKRAKVSRSRRSPLQERTCIRPDSNTRKTTNG